MLQLKDANYELVLIYCRNIDQINYICTNKIIDINKPISFHESNVTILCYYVNDLIHVGANNVNFDLSVERIKTVLEHGANIDYYIMDNIVMNITEFDNKALNIIEMFLKSNR